MKDNTYVAITIGLLLGVCLLVLIGAAPIQHWLEIPGTEWGAYDTSSNQLFKVRVSDKAFTLNGVLDAVAGMRAHGTINASSQTMTVDTSTARIANAQTMYATGAANALLLNASSSVLGGSSAVSGMELTVNGEERVTTQFLVGDFSWNIVSGTRAENTPTVHILDGRSTTNAAGWSAQLVIQGASNSGQTAPLMYMYSYPVSSQNAISIEQNGSGNAINLTHYGAGKALYIYTTLAGKGIDIIDAGALTGGSGRILEQRSGTESYLQLSQGGSATDQLVLKNGGAAIIGGNTLSATETLRVVGYGLAYGWQTTSSKDYKTNICDLEGNQVTELKRLKKPVIRQFKYKVEEKPSAANFAQDASGVIQYIKAVKLWEEKSARPEYHDTQTGFIAEELPEKYLAPGGKAWSHDAFICDHEQRIQELETVIQQLDERLKALEGK